MSKSPNYTYYRKCAYLFVFAIVFVSDHTIAFVSIVKSIVKNAIADAFPLIGNQSSCLPQSSSGKNIVYHFPNKIYKNMLRVSLTKKMVMKRLTRVTIPNPDFLP